MLDQNQIVIQVEEDDQPFTSFANTLIASPHLTAIQLRLYMVLYTYKGCKETYPSIKTLIAKCNCSKPTVLTAIKDLETLGLLTVIRGRTTKYGDLSSNVYRLHSYLKWLDKTSRAVQKKSLKPTK